MLGRRVGSKGEPGDEPHHADTGVKVKSRWPGKSEDQPGGERVGQDLAKVGAGEAEGLGTTVFGAGNPARIKRGVRSKAHRLEHPHTEANYQHQPKSQGSDRSKRGEHRETDTREGEQLAGTPAVGD